MRAAAFSPVPAWRTSTPRVSRSLLVKEDRSLEFRAEAFNVFNHAQFFGAASVEGNISSGSFGQAVSAMPPRLMQLALRYRF